MKGEIAKQENRMKNISLVGSVVRLGVGDEEIITERIFLVLVFREVLIIQ